MQRYPSWTGFVVQASGRSVNYNNLQTIMHFCLINYFNNWLAQVKIEHKYFHFLPSVHHKHLNQIIHFRNLSWYSVGEGLTLGGEAGYTLDRSPLIKSTNKTRTDKSEFQKYYCLIYAFFPTFTRIMHFTLISARAPFANSNWCLALLPTEFLAGTKKYEHMTPLA